MSQLQCLNCNTELHGRDVEFADGEARCRICGGPVRGGREMKRKRRRNGQQRHKAQVAVPPSIVIKRAPDGAGGSMLEVRVPWREQRLQAAGQLVFATAVVGVVWAAVQFEFSKLWAAGVIAAMFAVLIAVRHINHTVITVAHGAVAIRHAPIPWLSTVLEADSIEQLYVDRRPLAQKKFDYNVRAQLNDDDDVVVLFRSLSNPTVALYLEQCLEEHLKIVDRRVTGEFAPQPIADPVSEHPSVDVASNRPTG